MRAASQNVPPPGEKAALPAGAIVRLIVRSELRFLRRSQVAIDANGRAGATLLEIGQLRDEWHGRAAQEPANAMSAVGSFWRLFVLPAGG